MRGLRAAVSDIDLRLIVPDRGPRTSFMGVVNRARAWLRGNDITYRNTNLNDALTVATQVHHIDLGTASLVDAATRIGIDILLPSVAPLPTALSFPWVGYIFDFQHRQLPHFFTAKEFRFREHFFSQIMRDANSVIVNSRDTAKIAADLYPAYASKLFPLPFCAIPNPEWLAINNCAPSRGLNTPYFIISNRFWLHKDHETAFRALAMLPARHRDVAIVCTGETTDYRSREHFPRLMSLVESLGLTNRVLVVGLIPKAQQIALMKGSVALLQPTLCEGGPGGGATYDAISLGVPVILSNIPINFEISGERETSFFKARDPASLASLMTSALDSPLNRDPPEALLARGRDRWRMYTAALRDLIYHTIALRGDS